MPDREPCIRCKGITKHRKGCTLAPKLRIIGEDDDETLSEKQDRIPSDPLEIQRELERIEFLDAKRKGKNIGFRAFLESKQYCGLTLSPLMAAIADVSEGKKPDLSDAACMKHFGCLVNEMPTQPRRTVAVRAGLRGGKSSRLLAPKALHAAWTVPAPTLARKEFIYSLIVAPDTKLAKQTLSFIKGYIEESPVMSQALIRDTEDEIDIRRPDGKMARIAILAATKGGKGIRARTYCFVGMDEACFFFAEGTGAVTDTDIYEAAQSRVVPGGQAWIVSTPWLVGMGLLEKRQDKDWGKHEQSLCVRAGTRAMNPTWDPTGEVERDMRANGEANARREIDGEPLAGGSFMLFDPTSLDRAVDKLMTLPRAPKPGEEVTAGADMGLKNDCSTMAVVHRDHQFYYLADIMEMVPGVNEPLKPTEVVDGFAERALTHAGLSYIVADGHYLDLLNERLGERGLAVQHAPAGNEGVSEVYMKAKTLLREGKVKMPNHPKLIAQLRSISWQPNSGGGMSVKKPRTKIGVATADTAGHCDLADAFVLALWSASGLPVPYPPPQLHSPEYWAKQEEDLWSRKSQELEESKTKEFWEDC